MSNPPILIVDDKVELLELFATALRRLPYPIMTAQDGNTAISLLEQYVPVLIILDIAMPHPNGLELMSYVRSGPQYNETKILVVTAVPMLVGPKEADLYDQLLPKPITPRALEQAVLNLLGE